MYTFWVIGDKLPYKEGVQKFYLYRPEQAELQFSLWEFENYLTFLNVQFVQKPDFMASKNDQIADFDFL